MKAFLARVYGRVQRVGYRRFVLDSAQELGLVGFVRNERDGSVTVFAQGDDNAVERFVEALKSPPPPAYVKSVDIRDAKPRPGLKYFTVKPSPLHEELGEGFGAMQSIFMNYWGEFRGFVGEFRDYRNDFRSFVGEFRDFREESLNISREILGEVKGLRKDLQTMLDERLTKMEKDIAEIKAKIGLV